MSTDTRVDKSVRWFKNHPRWSKFILVCVVIIGVGAVAGAIRNVIDLFPAKSNDSKGRRLLGRSDVRDIKAKLIAVPRVNMYVDASANDPDTLRLASQIVTVFRDTGHQAESARFTGFPPPPFEGVLIHLHSNAQPTFIEAINMLCAGLDEDPKFTNSLKGNDTMIQIGLPSVGGGSRRTLQSSAGANSPNIAGNNNTVIYGYVPSNSLDAAKINSFMNTIIAENINARMTLQFDLGFTIVGAEQGRFTTQINQKSFIAVDGNTAFLSVDRSNRMFTIRGNTIKVKEFEMPGFPKGAGFSRGFFAGTLSLTNPAPRFFSTTGGFPTYIQVLNGDTDSPVVVVGFRSTPL